MLQSCMVGNLDISEALKACGYVHHNGKRTEAEFEALFGFKPGKYPGYFRTVGERGLVVVTDTFRNVCDSHFAAVRQNYARLGVTA